MLLCDRILSPCTYQMWGGSLLCRLRSATMRRSHFNFCNSTCVVALTQILSSATVYLPLINHQRESSQIYFSVPVLKHSNVLYWLRCLNLHHAHPPSSFSLGNCFATEESNRATPHTKCRFIAVPPIDLIQSLVVMITCRSNK